MWPAAAREGRESGSSVRAHGRARRRQQPGNGNHTARHCRALSAACRGQYEPTGNTQASLTAVADSLLTSQRAAFTHEDSLCDGMPSSRRRRRVQASINRSEPCCGGGRQSAAFGSGGRRPSTRLHGCPSCVKAPLGCHLLQPPVMSTTTLLRVTGEFRLPGEEQKKRAD